ncbi:HAD family hydrolase [Aliiruegeria lutimaris]|uniref:Predicted hydrolase, HAD superfamily n=1 Tax=Aliiruegeria lutimaris TaxID=571298 RepID=A0A1G8VYB2_9RHOB|nr:hypothetical protein [Aliiruegeria lutimaris]SDJ70906.1 Predicted hydrolase, HAD superfamily [Aliiruegeria lutimaris]
MRVWSELTDHVQVVTFDIFDTLLHRKIRAPVDLFELVRLKVFETDFALRHHDFLHGYAGFRRAAEQDARKAQLQHSEEGEICLDEIFEQLRSDHALPGPLVDYLKATELELEDTVLFASPDGMRRYNAARGKGLQIGFISDMYLPGDWLSQKLEREGFEGAAQWPLYVSGEHRVTKRSGALYHKVGTEQGWPLNERWLHVGDNRAADIDRAEALGLRTTYADWADVINRPLPEEAEFGANAITAITGFIDKRPSMTFQPEGMLERIGYRVFGPLMFGFTLWLLHQSQQQDLKKLLFIARDGKLAMRLFNRLKARAGLADIGTEYFYMSRKVGYLTGMREWDSEQTRRITIGRRAKSARRSFDAVGLDAEAYREELSRFGVEDIDIPVAPEEAWRVMKAIDTAFADVLRRNAEARAALQPYYLQAMEGADRIGFVDIGWVGNIQRLFANSLPDANARDRLVGLYLGQLPSSSFNEARGIRMHSFLTQGAYKQPVQKALHQGGIELLEFAMTADHGTTIDLSRDAEGHIAPVLETPSAEETDYARKAVRVQDGMEYFLDEHAYLLDHFKLETLATPHWALPLLKLVDDPTPEQIGALADLTHSDALGSNAERLPLVSPLSGWKRYSPSHRRKARRSSYWKGAFDQLLRRP